MTRGRRHRNYRARLLRERERELRRIVPRTSIAKTSRESRAEWAQIMKEIRETRFAPIRWT